MLGTRQSRAGVLARETSPLASQLQQAWLQSQIQSQAPKLQKRGTRTLGVDDVSVQHLIGQQFHQVASDLPSIVPDCANQTGFPNVVKKEELYFHKSRPETPEFPKRPETPQLVSYSRKADKPQKPRSCNVLDRRSSLSSASSGPSSPSSTVSFESVQLHQEFDTPLDVADYANCGTLDLACQSEPLVRFLDGMLAEDNMDGKKFTSQEGFDYHAIAKGFNDLARPNLAFECGSSDFADGDYDMSWASMGILPTEEAVADKLIHAYTSNLNKHVTDVSENVDSSTWVNERDACTDHSDQSWDWYLERLRPSSTARTMSSAYFQGDSLGQDMSPDALSAFPAVCVDLKTLLLKCAFVVSKDDVRTANDLIRELRMHSSVHGTALQRMAYYYMEALVAKMSGTGPQLYMAITSNTPSTATMLKAHRLFVDYSPYIKVTHFFSTKTILDAFEGADRVHLVDYGVAYGVQWPCLIQRLSQRKGGPPHLRITCIDLPQPGGKVSARVKEVGCRLAEFAQLWEVPFEFNALADKWESITSAHLCLNQDEVLAVNCQYRLRNLLDESIMAASPRKLVLEKIRSMNPKVFVMLTVNANYNAPFFMTRFRESMKYYFTMFDAMEVSMPSNDPDRVILEREFYGREILNIVACEGVERVERAESYRQWQTLTQRAGFTQKPLSPILTSKIKAMMGSYHKDYGLGEDGNWFLMGWKNQIVRAMTVWEPTPATIAT